MGHGDYIYVGHAVQTIMQHNVLAAPLFYYLACVLRCSRTYKFLCRHRFLGSSLRCQQWRDRCSYRTEVALPNEAPERFLDKFDPETVFQPVYAMSSIVDESLRNVTGALQAKGMWQNTLMVVASDNVRPLAIPISV